MKALIFLNVRQFVNGIRRAFSSGRRIIGLLFGLSYYVFVIFRPAYSGRQRPSIRTSGPTPDFHLLPGAVDSLVFGAFCFISLLMLLGVTTAQARFRMADIDCMFPTPVNRRIVMLGKFFRDSLVTILLPLFMMMFMVLPNRRLTQDATFAQLFKDLPSPLIFRYGMMAYFISAITWVLIGYACSLYFNRPLESSEKARKWFTRGTSLFLLTVLCTITFLTYRDPRPETLIAIAQSPLMRAIFFIPTACTSIAMAPSAATPVTALLGIGMLFAIGGAALYLALRQDSWFYEIGALAASKMSDTQELARKGDTAGIWAAQARQGKVKVRQWRWIQRWRPRGTMAIIWREITVQSRVGMFLTALPLLIAPMMLTPLFVTKMREPAKMALFVGVTVFTAFMSSMNATSGIYELLRRGDLQKPLPFSAARVVWFEVIAKTIPACLTITAITLASIAAGFNVFLVMLTVWPAAIAFALLLVSITMMVTLLFPDIDDITQRGFRGLMSLLGLVICAGPTFGVFLGLYFLTKSFPLAAIVSMLPSLGIGMICANVSGGLYASFNPSE